MIIEAGIPVAGACDLTASDTMTARLSSTLESSSLPKIPSHPVAEPHPFRTLRSHRFAGEEAVQVGGEFCGARVAVGRRLLEALQTDRLQCPRHAGAQLPRRARLLEAHR